MQSYNWFPTIQPLANNKLGGTFDNFPVPYDYNWITDETPASLAPNTAALAALGSQMKPLYLPPDFPQVTTFRRCQMAVNANIPGGGYKVDTPLSELWITVDPGGLWYHSGVPNGSQNGVYHRLAVIRYRFFMPPFTDDLEVNVPFNRTNGDKLLVEMTNQVPVTWLRVQFDYD